MLASTDQEATMASKSDACEEVEATPGRLQRPHRLVSELRAAAKAADEDKGVLRLNYEKVLRVRTSRRQLHRALLIMDALIKSLERHGCTVRIGTRLTETELVLREGTISFRLDERTTRVAIPKPANRDSWWPKHEMVATGEFSLEFGRYVLRGSPHTWSDKKNLRLEAQVPDIIAAVSTWEEILRGRRLRREDEEARREEAKVREISNARSQETLRRQRAMLVANLESWERAERIRNFLMSVRQRLTDPEHQQWMEWASAQADMLDPLLRPESVIEAVTLEPHFTPPNSWEKRPTCWWPED
jgi:hypothetical protein